MALAHILAAGRDPLVLSTRCSILRSVGYSVRSATSVAESIDLFRADEFDLLLLCHSLPVHDRNWFIGVVRSAGSHVPIFAISSASEEFRAGLADGILPSRPQDLIRELAAVLKAGPCNYSTGGMPLSNSLP